LVLAQSISGPAAKFFDLRADPIDRWPRHKFSSSIFLRHEQFSFCLHYWSDDQ